MIGKKKVIAYFAGLPKTGHVSTDFLIAHLQAIGLYRFSAAELTQIAVKISNYDVKLAEKKRSAQFYDTLRDNFQPWQDQVEDCLQNHGGKWFAITDLAQCTMALARLGMHPGEKFVSVLCNRILRNDIRQWLGPFEISHLAQSLAIFDVMAPHDLTRKAALNLTQCLHGTECPQICRTAAIVCHTLRLPMNGWKAPPESKTVSPLETALFDAFAEVAGSILIKRDEKIEPINHRPDGVFQGERSAVVQMDGPKHFAGEWYLNGSSLLMTAAAAVARPLAPIIRLPYRLADAWLQARDRDAMFGFMCEALAQPAGGYLYRGPQSFRPVLAVGKN